MRFYTFYILQPIFLDSFLVFSNFSDFLQKRYRMVPAPIVVVLHFCSLRQILYIFENVIIFAEKNIQQD